jgi:hypothetical protein
LEMPRPRLGGRPAIAVVREVTPTLKLIEFLFAALGFITCHVILDPRERSADSLAVVIVGNLLMRLMVFACLFARRRSTDPVGRHNLLVYFVILPVIFYLCGLGYAAYSTAR